MAIFEIQGPDGKTYEVEADSIEQAARAFAPQDIKPNPDGTYGQPPEGMVYNPNTGQMTSRELLANNMDPGAATSAAVGTYQGLGFGFGDEVQGALNAGAVWQPGTAGERYAYGREYARAREDAARRNNPVATTAGELGGAVATSMMPLGAGTQAASRAGQVVPRVASAAGKAPLASRMAGSMAAGAGLGGLYGFGAGEGGAQERAKSAVAAGVLGAGTGAAVPLVGAGVQRGLNARAGRKAIKEAARGAPTSEELRAIGKSLYDEVDRAGVQVSPGSFDQVRQKISDELLDMGYDQLPGAGGLTPKTARVMQTADEMSKEMAGNPSAALPFRSLDQLRRRAGVAASNQDKTEQALGSHVISELDDFVQGLSPGDVVAGDADALKSAIPKAREAWARMSRSQKIDDAIEAGSGAGSGYLGQGASGIRNQFGNILRNPKLSRGFTEAEKAAMGRVVSGGPGGRLLHNMGSGLGQVGTTLLGGAAGTAIPVPGVGTAVGALGGAAIGNAVGRASRAVALRDAEIARAAIASGKLGETLPTVSPQVRAIVEQLLRGGMAPVAGS